MNLVKHKSCPGWILATAFSWVCTSLLAAMMVIRSFPQMGWLVPALGAGIWVTLVLFLAGWKLQKEDPEGEFHPILYIFATAFAVVAGGIVFFAAIHQALAH
uniref:Uncharacterized protein n=1 Tax=mine drainage metagenome TaxID=410659 RepID=E6QE04_9ZZZZ